MMVYLIFYYFFCNPLGCIIGGPSDENGMCQQWMMKGAQVHSWLRALKGGTKYTPGCRLEVGVQSILIAVGLHKTMWLFRLDLFPQTETSRTGQNKWIEGLNRHLYMERCWGHKVDDWKRSASRVWRFRMNLHRPVFRRWGDCTPSGVLGKKGNNRNFAWC